jgi:hypothetical protein
MFLILEVSAMIITGTVALISKLILRSFFFTSLDRNKTWYSSVYVIWHFIKLEFYIILFLLVLYLFNCF